MERLRTPDGKLNVTGDRIAVLREAMGLSQNGLAGLLQLKGWNVHKNAISKIEQGKRSVSDLELILIASVLGTTARAFLQDET